MWPNIGIKQDVISNIILQTGYLLWVSTKLNLFPSLGDTSWNYVRFCYLSLPCLNLYILYICDKRFHIFLDISVDRLHLNKCERERDIPQASQAFHSSFNPNLPIIDLMSTPAPTACHLRLSTELMTNNLRVGAYDFRSLICSAKRALVGLGRAIIHYIVVVLA